MRLGAEKTPRGVSGSESSPIRAPYPFVFITVRGRTAENIALPVNLSNLAGTPARLRGADKAETPRPGTGRGRLQTRTPNSKPKLQTPNTDSQPATGNSLRNLLLATRPVVCSNWDVAANWRPEKRLPYCLGLTTASICSQLPENVLEMADGTEAAITYKKSSMGYIRQAWVRGHNADLATVDAGGPSRNSWPQTQTRATP